MVNKDNFKFLINFVFGIELLEVLKVELEFLNLKLDDFEFIVDKLVIVDKEGKLVIEVKLIFKLIIGIVILDILYLVVKLIEENYNIVDVKKLFDEVLKNLFILESKMDSNIKNIEKWEVNILDGGVFIEEVKKIKEILL